MAAEWTVLLLAGGEAVCQVLVVVACGALLSRTGYLSNSGQKAVSKLNLYFLTPCLLFTKMASTITWSQFKAFWPIPLIYTLYSFINWVTAKIGSRLLGFTNDEEKFVIASVFFSNTNSLPMALVQSLAMSAAGVRLLRDELDTKEMVMARGISYILFYAIFGNLVRWSYGFSLLVPKDEEEEEVKVDEIEGISTGAGGIVERKDFGVKEAPMRVGEVCIDIDERGLNSTSCMTKTDNNLHTQRNQHPSSSSPPSASHSSSPSPTTTTLLQKFASFFNKLRQVLTPPLLTALIALVVGLVPALHQFFMSPESKFYTFVIHPLEECGEGAIPLILICLGAQVVHLASTSTPSPPSSPSSPPSLPSSSAAEGDSEKSKQVDRAPSVRHNSDISSLEESTEEEERAKYCLNRDRLSIKHAEEEELTPRLPLSHASSSFTLYQPDAFTDSRTSHDHDASASSPVTSNSDNNSNNSNNISINNISSNNISNSNNRPRRCNRVSPVGYAILARTLIAPLICLPFILFHPSSISPLLTTDPVFKMVLVLIAAAPTAINLTQLCQIKGFFEREMASLLFWSYCVLGVPLVLGWSLVGLWAAGRR